MTLSYFKGRIQDLETVGMNRERSAKVKQKGLIPFPTRNTRTHRC